MDSNASYRYLESEVQLRNDSGSWSGTTRRRVWLAWRGRQYNDARVRLATAARAAAGVRRRRLSALRPDADRRHQHTPADQERGGARPAGRLGRSRGE